MNKNIFLLFFICTISVSNLFAQTSDSSKNNISTIEVLTESPEIIGTPIINDSANTNPFQEVLAQFPEGETAMLKFLNDSLRYPKEARKKNIQGKVFVHFIVTEIGELKNIEVLKGLPYGLSEEAIRVVQLMPKWIPGSQLEKNVPIQFT
ncbi:MAG: energy transducer TonB [Sphingobacteriales bacterium]|nr:MAG: energy transducer TonB [Sphingobacteriales bacterium]